MVVQNMIGKTNFELVKEISVNIVAIFFAP